MKRPAGQFWLAHPRHPQRLERKKWPTQNGVKILDSNGRVTSCLYLQHCDMIFPPFIYSNTVSTERTCNSQKDFKPPLPMVQDNNIQTMFHYVYHNLKTILGGKGLI